MSLTETQLLDLLAIAKQAALAAGDIINSFQGKEITSNLKSGGTSIASKIVTEVDAKAEVEILKFLEPAREKYDLGLLTEESTDDQSRFEKNYFWCIDPLDGTLPFTENSEGYATSIALVTKQGNAVLGVVFDPRNQNLYSAIKGHGAFKNELPLNSNPLSNEVTIIDGPGGAVMQAISTIEQSPCIFYKKPKPQEGGGCLWDYAATTVIHSEAGGYNSDYRFKPINLNNSDTVYMNPYGVCFSTGLSREQRSNYLSD